MQEPKDNLSITNLQGLSRVMAFLDEKLISFLEMGERDNRMFL
ncbi:MAG: hypothetical protein Q8N55_01185 [bacterium]|nr:hypothetical protein [bacterium]